MPWEGGGALLTARPEGAAANVQGEVRMVIAGGRGVGKSALAVRFLTRRFIGEYEHSPELVYSKRVELDGQTVALEVHDTHCQSPGLSPRHLLLVIYSITDRSSLSAASSILRSCFPIADTRQVMLVGNKQDLEHLREVELHEGEALASQYKIAFSEVSVAESPDHLIALLNSSIMQVAKEMGVKTRKQPVWSMRGVLGGLLGSRSSLPPELGDSRAKQPKRSIKEVFKKRSV